MTSTPSTSAGSVRLDVGLQRESAHAPEAEHSFRRAVSGAAWLSGYQLLLNALSVPALGYIIRELGAVPYAHWMTAVGLLTFATLTTNMGLRPAFVRRVASRRQETGEALAEQLGLRLVLSAIAGLCVLLACWGLGYPPIVLWCACVGGVGLLLTTISTTLGDVLQATQRVRPLARASLVSGLCLTLCAAGAAWAGGGATGVACAYLIGPLVSILMLAQVVRTEVAPIRVRCTRGQGARLLGQSRHFAVQHVLFAGSGHAEALLAPLLLGMGPFGLFTAGSLFASRLAVIPDSLCTAAYPSLVHAAQQGRVPVRAMLLRYLALSVVGGIVIAAGVTVIALPVARMLLPAEPVALAGVIRLTIWALPLVSVELVLGYALTAARREAVQARVAWPASLLGVLTSVALITTMGLEGACWSMLARPTIRSAFLVPECVRTFWLRLHEDSTTTNRVDEFRKAG